jgi:SSS family solute:Na+ symporter
VYQLLQDRFGAGVKAFAAALFVVMRTIGDGIRLLLTALVLAAVVGAVSGTSAETVVTGSVVLIGAVMILFTLWGGMEAVIWIEVVQLGIYVVGALAAAAVIAHGVPGGLAGALETGARFGKLRFFDFHLTPHGSYVTFWAGVIGGAFLTMSTHGTDQYLVQRYLCTDRPRRAAAALLVSGVVVFLQFVLFLGIGVLLFAFYRPFESPVFSSGPPAAPFARADAVFPDFITHHLPTPLAGLVVAAIFAAAMSSSLNSIAATILNDLWGPLASRRAVRADRSDTSDLRLSRLLTLAAGVFQIGVALLVRSSPKSALDSALTVAALLNGPILGVFLIGALTRRAGKAAALTGMAAGMAASLFFFFAHPIEWPWYAAIGSLTTLAVGGAAGELA